MSTNVQVSTGLRNLQLVAVKAALDLGFIDLYAGPIPASADNALVTANVLLCTISNGGAGITFAAAPNGGVLQKNGNETWSGINLASGTATFYRFRQGGDTGLLSTLQPRIQGTVGVTNESINLSQGTTLSQGQTTTTTLSAYAYEQPTY